MTANKFGGYLQRTEEIKGLAKVSMASMCILEKEGLFHIYGVWLFRGPIIPPELFTVDDTNYYTWDKVDVTNEDQKNLVSDYLSWESLNNWNGVGNFVGGKTFGV